MTTALEKFQEVTEITEEKTMTEAIDRLEEMFDLLEAQNLAKAMKTAGVVQDRAKQIKDSLTKAKVRLPQADKFVEATKNLVNMLRRGDMAKAAAAWKAASDAGDKAEAELIKKFGEKSADPERLPFSTFQQISDAVAKLFRVRDEMEKAGKA